MNDIDRQESISPSNQVLAALEHSGQIHIEEWFIYRDAELPRLKSSFSDFVSSVVQDLPSYLKYNTWAAKITSSIGASNSSIEISGKTEQQEVNYYFVPEKMAIYVPLNPNRLPVYPNSENFNGFEALGSGFSRLRDKDFQNRLLYIIDLVKESLKGKAGHQPTSEEIEFNQNLQKFKERDSEILTRAAEDQMEGTLRYLQRLEDQLGKKSVPDALPYDRKYFKDLEGRYYYLVRSQKKILSAYAKKSSRIFGREIPDLDNAVDVSLTDQFQLLTSPGLLEKPQK